MDWNWFYSSAAQSIAALVGVLGAFLVALMLNNQGAYGRTRARTRNLLLGAEQLADRAASRRFEWFNQRSLDSGLEAVKSDVKYKLLTAKVEHGTEEVPGSAEDYYNEMDFSPYLPREEVLARIEQAIADAREEEERQRSRKVPDYSFLTSRPEDGAIVAARRQRFEAEQEAIAQLVVQVKGHIREVEEHLGMIRTNPERSGVVRVTLAAILLLFWVGTIYPLCYLPVAASGVHAPSFSGLLAGIYSSRGLIIAVAAVLFSGLIVFLGIQNERLTHPPRELEELQRRLAVETYSDHLKVRVDNGVPL